MLAYSVEQPAGELEQHVAALGIGRQAIAHIEIMTAVTLVADQIGAAEQVVVRPASVDHIARIAEQAAIVNEIVVVVNADVEMEFASVAASGVAAALVVSNLEVGTAAAQEVN